MGPIFRRELQVQARSLAAFVQRLVFPAAFTILMSTAWAIMTGAQRVQTVGDMARFGSAIYQLMAPLLLILLMFAAAILSVSIVAQEKDRKTLILLLMTRLTNRELVVGKLFAALVPILVIWLVVLPVFFATVLLGGVSPRQVIRTFMVIFVSAVAAGALGVVIAYWRERTFQGLALVILILGAWIGFGEVLHAGWLGPSFLGISTQQWSEFITPLRALLANSTPFPDSTESLPTWLQSSIPFVWCSLILSLGLSMIGIAYVRKWNTADEIRGRPGRAQDLSATAGGTPESATDDSAELARQGHVDSRRRRRGDTRIREVWDNPILWREICTWAHGRRILIVRLAFLALFAFAAFAIQQRTNDTTKMSSQGPRVNATTQIFVPLVFVSMLMVNAIAVTSITMERDGKALDTLLATDLTPKEFIFGKLAGVASVGGLMLLCPLALAIYLQTRGDLSLENLVYLIVTLITFSLFSIMLGIHCGMSYANSRNAIAVSLGTLFFLSLGVIACVFIMVSFSESFQLQLAPFLAFILGGGLGLFVVLSAGSPSNAIAMASAIIPIATFYVITTMLLRQYLPAFLVTIGSYGFATAAMMIPKLSELDFATDRASSTDA